MNTFWKDSHNIIKLSLALKEYLNIPRKNVQTFQYVSNMDSCNEIYVNDLNEILESEWIGNDSRFVRSTYTIFVS
jgi:hypothetical protein